MAEQFINSQQYVVPATTLKEDLARIITHWNGLSEEQKREYSRERGSYPPEIEDSITNKIWKEVMSPWKPGSGNRASEMSEEENKRLMERIKPIIDAIEKQRKKEK